MLWSSIYFVFCHCFRVNIQIMITQGYSRDHRPDLKQCILDLIVSSDGDIP